ncbi:MAG: sulfotransferase [Fidelibacterota bacterium]|nr:MAG: sulfotransferase [Candidatus Neomarinimicrobiota bacterium]
MRYAFLIGVARSGTSILGELIASHPEVKYIFEVHPIWELGGEGENGSHRLTELHAKPYVANWIRKWFSTQAEPGRLLLEKNPRNSLRVPYLNAIFPAGKIIHIVRDGRDAACSMVPGCGGEQWSHLKPPSWQQFFHQYQGVIRCAHAWREAISIALDDLAKVDHLQVRYEDLVQTPADVAREVLAYLELDANPEVDSFCNNIQNSTADSYHAGVQTMWYRENHSVRVQRYRENMTAEELRTVNTLLAPILQKLGYPLDGEGDLN